MVDKVTEGLKAVTTALVAIKNFTKYLIIPTGAIMIAPDDWLLRFHLLNFKNDWGHWFAIIFLLFVSFIIIDWFGALKKKFADMHRNKQTMENLNMEEWDIIYRIYRNNSYDFDFKQASVAKLKAQKLIFSSQIGTVFGFSYTLQPWVRTYLKERPQLINDFMQKRHQAISEAIKQLVEQAKQNTTYSWELIQRIEKLQVELEEYE